VCLRFGDQAMLDVLGEKMRDRLAEYPVLVYEWTWVE
jgi:hypothetical protein